MYFSLKPQFLDRMSRVDFEKDKLEGVTHASTQTRTAMKAFLKKERSPLSEISLINGSA